MNNYLEFAFFWIEGFVAGLLVAIFIYKRSKSKFKSSGDGTFKTPKGVSSVSISMIGGGGGGVGVGPKILEGYGGGGTMTVEEVHQ